MNPKGRPGGFVESISMIRHLQMATVWVTDVERSAAFFTEKLGFIKTAEFHREGWPSIVWVVPSDASSTSLGTEIGLEQAPSGDPRIGGPTGLVFSSNDVAQTYLQLIECGVTFSMDLIRHDYGEGEGDQEARFLDPDGNEFLLHT